MNKKAQGKAEGREREEGGKREWESLLRTSFPLCLPSVFPSLFPAVL
jgi:hypothetical protein